jgi:hypothetical protein
MVKALETRQELRPVSSDILPTWIETLESRRLLSVSGQSTVETVESTTIEIIAMPVQHVMPLHHQIDNLGFGQSSFSSSGYNGGGMRLINDYNNALAQWAAAVNAALQNWAAHEFGVVGDLNSGQQTVTHHAPVAHGTDSSGSTSDYVANTGPTNSQKQSTTADDATSSQKSTVGKTSTTTDNSTAPTTAPQQAAGEKVTNPAPQAVAVQSVFSDTHLTAPARQSLKDAALADATPANLKDARERSSKSEESSSSLLNDLRNDKISLTVNRHEANTVERIGRRVIVPIESSAMRSLLRNNRHDDAATEMPGRQFVPMQYDAADLAAMQQEDQGQFTWKQMAALVGTGVLIGSYAIAVQRRRKMLMAVWPGIETER